MSTEDMTKSTLSENDTAITSIGESMAQMRLMVGRRYISRVVIERIGAGMELSHLDVLGLVRRLTGAQEITIGTIAEHMRIDQSRASRVVTELVKRGELRREVSQEDARRTIVTLTPEGAELIGKMRAVKRELLTQTLSDWPDEEVAEFARLYEKFTQRMNEGANAYDAEISGNKGTET